MGGGEGGNVKLMCTLLSLFCTFSVIFYALFKILSDRYPALLFYCTKVSTAVAAVSKTVM